jgi:hypothetical protein
VEPTVAGITAALLTLFDLDRTFYVPSKVPRKVALWAWWWGFIVANGLLAAALYGVIGNTDALRNWNPWLKAVTVGLSYLALVRLKLTTFTFQGKEVPGGFELFYEAAKEFVYKRINKIAKAARFDETTELSNKLSLPELAARAKLSIEQDALLPPEEKRSRKAWVLKVLTDNSSSDSDKRSVLADYILSGQRASDTV